MQSTATINGVGTTILNRMRYTFTLKATKKPALLNLNGCDMEDTEQEKELVFRRFPEEKQEQVRQLVAYTTLMGLTGKDLVSIGGKLARIEEKKEAIRLIEIAKSYESSIVPAGKNAKERKNNEGSTWIYTDVSGQKWRFETNSMWSINIRSMSTGKNKHVYLNNSLPMGVRRSCRGKTYMYNALIALHQGEFTLNF